MEVSIKNLKQTIIKICLSAALLLSAVTVSSMFSTVEAYAAETITISDTITGTLSDDGLILTLSGTGEVPELSSLVTGYQIVETVIIEDGITSLGSNTFKGCTSLKSVDIPNSVTTIGKNAFYKCTSLTEITLPSQLQTIGDNAFYDAAIIEITIPKTVTAAKEVFTAGVATNNTLKKITFEDGMTAIPASICYNCAALTEIIIPDSVTSIENYAFKGCSSITEITLSSNLTTMGYYIFQGCTNLKELIIPKSLTTVSGNDTLGNSSIEVITFEDGMTTIPQNMCLNCKTLKTVNIPESVTEIGSTAFRGCTSLTEITLPSQLQTIGNNAFYNTAITEITIPKNVTSARNLFVMGYTATTSLQSITFEAGMTTIPKEICYGCAALTEITIPDSITSIGSDAFKVSSETPTTVHTSNDYVMSIDWGTTYNRVVTFIDPSAFQEGLTMTGTVSPITTIDISIPLDSISFTIDEERNLTAETTQITNNSQYPLDMYILSIEPINNAPEIIAEDTYTEKEWNNLSAADTLKYISISVNDNELYEVFNNTERNHDLAILIGRLKSGYVGAETLDLTPSAQYGKSFLNTEDLVLQYKVVFEVVIP